MLCPVAKLFYRAPLGLRNRARDQTTERNCTMTLGHFAGRVRSRFRSYLECKLRQIISFDIPQAIFDHSPGAVVEPLGIVTGGERSHEGCSWYRTGFYSLKPYDRKNVPYQNLTVGWLHGTEKKKNKIKKWGQRYRQTSREDLVDPSMHAATTKAI